PFAARGRGLPPARHPSRALLRPPPPLRPEDDRVASPAPAPRVLDPHYRSGGSPAPRSSRREEPRPLPVRSSEGDRRPLPAGSAEAGEEGGMSGRPHRDRPASFERDAAQAAGLGRSGNDGVERVRSTRVPARPSGKPVAVAFAFV